MNVWEAVIWGVAVLILIPVLLNPAGWLFGLALLLVWLAIAYGVPHLIDLEKQRRQGERGMAKNIRNREGDS